MLTAEDQGILLVCVLNRLPFLGDYLNPAVFAEGCCPDCCEECAVVWRTDRSGKLDEFIAFAPQELWADSAWWRNGQVDRVWLYAVWERHSDTDDDTGRRTLDDVVERYAREHRLTAPEAYRLLQDRLAYEDTLSGDEQEPVTIQL